MRRFITCIFYKVLCLLFLCSIIVAVACLFDSQPQNLYWVWIKLSNIVTVTILLSFLFGGKK
jgi:hypothetical protein